MVDLNKHQFAFQIKELREYINFLDEKIARYEKTGRSTERLKENKSRALSTIAELQAYQDMKAEIAPYNQNMKAGFRH